MLATRLLSSVAPCFCSAEGGAVGENGILGNGRPLAIAPAMTEAAEAWDGEPTEPARLHIAAPFAAIRAVGLAIKSGGLAKPPAGARMPCSMAAAPPRYETRDGNFGPFTPETRLLSLAPGVPCGASLPPGAGTSAELEGRSRGVRSRIGL
mmetsp:Transcript_105276/g.297965  ORF Transcript_105276/g.297965 Transcript_105276/m.297965 type:complete len:151 (+) Transcript_105276:345-797(+)